MIKLFIENKEVPFEITKFPDGTSQAWKAGSAIYGATEAKVLWLFENEAELITICQLGQLIKKEAWRGLVLELEAPFLPYSRQDKPISNVTTFALDTFFTIVQACGYFRVRTFDAHSRIEEYMGISETPVHFFNSIYNHDVICYPDSGAYARYNHSLSVLSSPIALAENLYCTKIRNQLTGQIEGLKIENVKDLAGKKVLIVDDLCDGGRTFIEVAKALKEHNPEQIDLAVSHGIFSKGKQVLHDAGITNIYTTNSLLNNPDGFKVW